MARRDIKKGEPITTNATQEIRNELTTFLESYENANSIQNLKWLKLGYRNARCSYSCQGKIKTLVLRRVDGNWEKVISEKN